ncbi:hypothetical protein [Schumannella sp. 10F1B-5-1]|uniref:hypothetical protein n=1 Tax=Schumannella sp. 10F1B-5-1 TaxID=2590780 RepID=UPI00113143CD|nr:hypothetical protein [Schumannella sp. 10F1B-5-1]
MELAKRAGAAEAAPGLVAIGVIAGASGMALVVASYRAVAAEIAKRQRDVDEAAAQSCGDKE